MNAETYINELSSAIDNFEYDKFLFLREGRALFPVLKTEIENTSFNNLDFYFRYFEKQEPDLDCLRTKPCHYENQYNVLIISNLRVFMFLQTPIGSPIIESVDSQEVILRTMSYNGQSCSKYYKIYYSKDYLDKYGFVGYKWDILENWSMRPDHILVIIATKYLDSKSDSFIVRYLQELLNDYLHSRRGEGESSLLEYVWKVHTQIIFIQYKYLFVDSELNRVWQAVMSFCDCKYEPSNIQVPFIKSKLKEKQLIKIFNYLTENDILAQDTSIDDFLYYLNGGNAFYEPSRKIEWISEDAALFYALLDILNPKSQNNWGLWNSIFKSKYFTIDATRRRSLTRDVNKKYSGKDKMYEKDNPYRTDIKFLKDLIRK